MGVRFPIVDVPCPYQHEQRCGASKPCTEARLPHFIPRHDAVGARDTAAAAFLPGCIQEVSYTDAALLWHYNKLVLYVCVRYETCKLQYIVIVLRYKLTTASEICWKCCWHSWSWSATYRQTGRQQEIVIWPVLHIHDEVSYKHLSTWSSSWLNGLSIKLHDTILIVLYVQVRAVERAVHRVIPAVEPGVAGVSPQPTPWLRRTCPVTVDVRWNDPKWEHNAAEWPAVPGDQRRHGQHLQSLTWRRGLHASMWVLRLDSIPLAMQAHACYFSAWREDVGRPMSRISGQSILCTGRRPVRRGVVADTHNQRRHRPYQWRRTTARHRTVWRWRRTVRQPVTILHSSALPGTPPLARGRQLHVHWPGRAAQFGAVAGSWPCQHAARSAARRRHRTAGKHSHQGTGQKTFPLQFDRQQS